MSLAASSKPTEAFVSDPSHRERIWHVVSLIPPGRVANYGQIASLAGLPNGAREVGRVLGQLPIDTTLPWHRVITSSGRIAFAPKSAAFQEQQLRLARDGVPCSKGKVSMAKYQWEP